MTLSKLAETLLPSVRTTMASEDESNWTAQVEPRSTSPSTIMSKEEELRAAVDVNVLIVGGGPHALAAMSALHEKSFLFPQFASETAFDRRVGYNGLRKVGSGASRMMSQAVALADRAPCAQLV